MALSISGTAAALHRQFVDRLPARSDAIRSHPPRLDRAAWQPGEADALHRPLHGFTGSAGTYCLLGGEEDAP